VALDIVRALARQRVLLRERMSAVTTGVVESLVGNLALSTGYS
jgi:hypothetical protein